MSNVQWWLFAVSQPWVPGPDQVCAAGPSFELCVPEWRLRSRAVPFGYCESSGLLAQRMWLGFLGLQMPGHEWDRR